MYAIEFETTINNGTLQLPEQFRQLPINSKAKIIIMLDDDNQSQKTDFIEMLANNPKHVEHDTEFLSREQANER